MDTKILEDLGLTQGEVKVYLALFKLGSTTTGPIVKKAKIHASKVYPILDRLIEKGLVSFVKKGKKTFYEAAPARRILDYVHEKQASLKQQESSVLQILPQLELQRKIEEKITEATVFKGIKALCRSRAGNA